MNLLKFKNDDFKFHTQGDGKATIFISGLGASYHIWDKVLENLPSKYYTITFDNYGYGENDSLCAPTNTIEMAKNVLLLVRHLGLKKLSLIGHSLGSYVAQYIASIEPHVIDKLILISTRKKSSINTRLHYNVVMKLMEIGVPRDILIQDSFSWLYSNSFLSNKEYINKLMENIITQKPAISKVNLFNQISAAVSHDSSHILGSIIAKTLILHGDEDILVTQREAELVKNAIKHSRIVYLQDTAHMPMIEVPTKLSEIINMFLDEGK